MLLRSDFCRAFRHAHAVVHGHLLKQPVRLTYLDLQRLEEAVAGETQHQIERIVQTRSLSEVYDENRRYRPEVANEAYLAALNAVQAAFGLEQTESLDAAIIKPLPQSGDAVYAQTTDRIAAQLTARMTPTQLKRRMLADGSLPETTGVLCRRNAGEMFGLHLLEENLEDDSRNMTEFVLIKAMHLYSKTVIVAGLGLIGGSMAKAIKKHTDCKVLGWNRTRAVAEQALADGAVDAIAADPEGTSFKRLAYERTARRIMEGYVNVD